MSKRNGVLECVFDQIRKTSTRVRYGLLGTGEHELGFRRTQCHRDHRHIYAGSHTMSSATHPSFTPHASGQRWRSRHASRHTDRRIQLYRGALIGDLRCLSDRW